MATLLCYNALLSYTLILPTISLASATSLSADTFTVSYEKTSDSPAFDTNYRSTVEIVWSCLTVIIASSWLCVHPNVTGHSTTMWQRLRERLVLFALAILAPELLAVFASYQWWGSRRLYQEFKGRADELNIPLQLNSEASPLEAPETPNDSDTIGQAENPLDPEDLSALAGRITRTPGSEESDKLIRSAVRGDQGRWRVIWRCWKGIRSSFMMLACAISSCGTDPKKATWSYTHAHFVQMGGIAFRDDSGNVGFKRPEDWKDEDIREFFAMGLPEAAISDKSKAGALAKTLVVARVIWFLIQAIARAVQGLPISLLEVASLAFIIFNFAMYVFWWNKPLEVEYPLEIPGIFDQGQYCPDNVLRLVLFIATGALSETPPNGVLLDSSQTVRYPRLYAFGNQVAAFHPEALFVGHEAFSTYSNMTFNLMIAVTSSSFGAFHTIGWFLPAPSQVERTLWRVSCLGLTLYPFVLLVMFALSWATNNDYIAPNFGSVAARKRFYYVMPLIFGVIGLLGGIFYIGARLTIIFLPFFELRDLPPLVHQTVSWSRFISPV